MSDSERYTCSSCSRHFVASVNAIKVKCPTCGVSNILKPELLPPPKDRPSHVADRVPEYNLEEASEVAKKFVSEPVSDGWTKVQANYEGVEAYSKPIAIDQNQNEVYVTKATTTLDATPSQALNIYWSPNAELQWNTQTVSKVQVLEDLKSIQVVHQVHKQNPRINLTSDLVYRRSYDSHGKGYWVSMANESKPASPSYARARLVFGGLLIEPVDNRRSKLTLVWSFDINKSLHVQFVDEEPKKVALRLLKMRKMIEDDARLARAAADYEEQKKETLARNNAPGRGPQTTGNTGVVAGCTVCRRPDSGKFCSQCGERCFECCASCFAKALGSTCERCGNRTS